MAPGEPGAESRGHYGKSVKVTGQLLLRFPSHTSSIPGAGTWQCVALRTRNNTVCSKHAHFTPTCELGCLSRHMLSWREV